MTTVTLYSYPLAFNPAKAKLALEEHGIKYTEKKVDIFGGANLEPSYIKISPNGWVPTLVAGDLTLTESAEIVKWTDEQEPGPLGGDKVDRDFIAEWIPKVDAWDGNLFFAAFGSLGGVLKLTTEHKIKIAEANAKKYPDLAELYNKKAQGMKAALEEGSDKEKGEANKAQLVALLDEAETRLSKTKYLAGDEYSIADVIFTPCLYRIPAVKLENELLDPRENLKKYWLGLKKRPSYKKTFGVSDSGLGTAAIVLPNLGKIYVSKLFGKK
jgi:glutathione S-transferase